MEYREPLTSFVPRTKIQPRLIIHGGAGNIRRENYPSEKYAAYRNALLAIVSENSFFFLGVNCDRLSFVSLVKLYTLFTLLCVSFYLSYEG